jgi:conjugal transfer pilus assembly protein TraL
MTPVPIPNYVDDQPQFFFWEVDEFFPSLVIFIVLYMWDQLLMESYFTWSGGLA